MTLKIRDLSERTFTELSAWIRHQRVGTFRALRAPTEATGEILQLKFQRNSFFDS